MMLTVVIVVVLAFAFLVYRKMGATSDRSSLFRTIFDKFIVLYTFLVQASNLEMESDYFCYSFLHSFSLLSHPMHDAPMFGLLLAKYANL